MTEAFEARYRADPDPWRTLTDPYEFAQARAHAGGLRCRPVRAACDLGAGTGVLAAALAPRCDRLLALDGAPTAVAEAQRAARPFPHAEARVATAARRPARRSASTSSSPARSCTTWTTAPSARSLGWLPGALTRGGRAVAVHWTGSAPDLRRSADEVGAALAASPGCGRSRTARIDRGLPPRRLGARAMSACDLLVVGGGPAGHSAATAYRAAGGTGAVVLLAGEGRAPYERPPLSKELLRGRCEPDALPLADHARSTTSTRSPSATARALSLAPRRPRSATTAPARSPTSAASWPPARSPCARRSRAPTGRRPPAAHGRPTRWRCAPPPRPGSAPRPRLRLHRLRGRRVAARCAAATVTLVSQEPAPQAQRLGDEVAAAARGLACRRRGRRPLRARAHRASAPACAPSSPTASTVDADLVLLAGGVAPDTSRPRRRARARRRRRDRRRRGHAHQRAGVLAWATAAAPSTRSPAPAARRALGRRAGPRRGRGLDRRRREAAWDTVPGFWSTIGDRHASSTPRGATAMRRRAPRRPRRRRVHRLVRRRARRLRRRPHPRPRRRLRGRSRLIEHREPQPVSRLRASSSSPPATRPTHIERCLRRAGRPARARAAVAFEVVLVLDAAPTRPRRSRGPRRRAAGLALHVERSRGAGVGAAAATGWTSPASGCGREPSPRADRLHRRRHVVAPDWLAAQLALVDAGADAVGGRSTSTPPTPPRSRPPRCCAATARGRPADRGACRRPERRAPLLLRRVAGRDRGAYRAVGGIDPCGAGGRGLRAAADRRRLAHRPLRRRARSAPRRAPTAGRRAGWPATSSSATGSPPAATTAARTTGQRLLEAKGDTTISVVVPARDCAETVGGVLRTTVMPLVDMGLIDEVLVVDGRSTDATSRAPPPRRRAPSSPRTTCCPSTARPRARATRCGAACRDARRRRRVPRRRHRGPRPVPPARPARAAARGPRTSHLVKGAFARPFRDGEPRGHAEGGRVTELMARPLLNLHVPGAGRLRASRWPARPPRAATLLEALPFPVGYGVEIAMLIDALRHVGLDGLAEVAVGTRQNRHQSLRELGAMAFAVLCAVQARVGPAATRCRPAWSSRGTAARCATCRCSSVRRCVSSSGRRGEEPRHRRRRVGELQRLAVAGARAEEAATSGASAAIAASMRRTPEWAQSRTRRSSATTASAASASSAARTRSPSAR